jgi:hypothetical protein
MPPEFTLVWNAHNFGYGESSKSRRLCAFLPIDQIPVGDRLVLSSIECPKANNGVIINRSFKDNIAGKNASISVKVATEERWSRIPSLQDAQTISCELPVGLEWTRVCLHSPVG